MLVGREVEMSELVAKVRQRQSIVPETVLNHAPGLVSISLQLCITATAELYLWCLLSVCLLSMSLSFSLVTLVSGSRCCLNDAVGETFKKLLF